MGQRQDDAPPCARAARMIGLAGILGTRFGTGAALGALGVAERRIGEGRGGSFRRWALPITAFFETPRTLPMWDAL
jgi:hypothetical protein